MAAQTTKITNIEQIVGSLVWLASLHWHKMQPLALAAPTRQDLGTYSDTVTTPQPLGLSGPMARGHLMTVEIQGVDLKLFQAVKTNMHGVPSYFDSHVSNTTLGLRIGSITCGKNETFKPVINPSEFSAKQVPCRPEMSGLRCLI